MRWSDRLDGAAGPEGILVELLAAPLQRAALGADLEGVELGKGHACRPVRVGLEVPVSVVLGGMTGLAVVVGVPSLGVMHGEDPGDGVPGATGVELAAGPGRLLGGPS